MGLTDSGKFRLLQTLCLPHFGAIKTLDEVFDFTYTNTKKKKELNKLSMPEYMSRTKKLDLIKGQFKELQRTIGSYRKRS